MVLNHVAVRAVGFERLPTVSECALVGSFAPVFFFFLTGLGSGVQSVGRPRGPSRGYLSKVLVLFAADAMLWVSPTKWWGLDFFGFIGLSMFCLEWVRRVPRSGLLAAILAAFVFSVRFLLGSNIKSSLATMGLDWMGPVLGVNYVRGFSYVPFPWLFFPLVGYTTGRLAAKRSDPVRIGRPVIFALLAALTGLSFGATMVLRARGFELDRWGMMSLAYFTASLGALGTGLLLVLAASRSNALPALLQWFGLSGVRSFAVVPLHYALIPVFEQLLGEVVDLGSYVRNAAPVLVLSFAASGLVPKVAGTLNSPKRQRALWVVTWVGFVVALLLLTSGRLGAVLDSAVRFGTELALCVLLVAHRPKRPSNSGAARPETQQDQTSLERLGIATDG